MNCWEAFCSEGCGKEMDQTVESDAWHDVDEETGDFVEAVEYH